MRRWLIPRRMVQGAVFVLFLMPLIVSGWALLGRYSGGEDRVATPAELPFFGSLSSSTVAGVVTLDPFAALEITAASRSFDVSWYAAAAVVLVVYGVIGARAFCGWVCPVNLLLEFVDWIRVRLGIKVRERALPRHTKLGVAAGFLIVSFIVARPLFQGLSPIAALNKGLLFGAFSGGIVLVAIVILELFWAHRVWCRSLCPVGAVYQCIGRLGLFGVRIDQSSCTQCQRCKQVCLAAPEILDAAVAGEDDRVRAGDCMHCGACVDACPHHALTMRARWSK